jgi:hypothetical protein
MRGAGLPFKFHLAHFIAHYTRDRTHHPQTMVQSTQPIISYLSYGANIDFFVFRFRNCRVIIYMSSEPDLELDVQNSTYVQNWS